VKQIATQYSQFVFFESLFTNSFYILLSFLQAQTFAACIFVGIAKINLTMAYSVHYKKAQVLEALRYHFMKQSEIKTLMIVVNVYAIATGVLLFLKKIRPELFLLGSILWIILLLLFWYAMPALFYKKADLFKQDWTFSFNEAHANLYSNLGAAQWTWNELTHYFESPYFFHFYFGPKTFFLIPKENIPFEAQQELRVLLKHK